MAEKALKKVEEQLNCSICLDTYTDPKLLQCFHVYCRQCLVKLVYRDEHQQLVLSCPTCRQVSPVPARGVTGLPTAFHINQLLEIVETHRKEEDMAAGVEEDMAAGEGRGLASCVPQGKVTEVCPDHEMKELELFCETCELLICSHCALKGGRHCSHVYALVSDAFEKNKRKIASYIEPLEKQLCVVDETLEDIDQRHKEISDQWVAMETDLSATVIQLHKMLDAKRAEVSKQLDRMAEGKLKGLAVQRDQVETSQAQLGSCLWFVKCSLQADSRQGEALRMLVSISKQVSELTKPLSKPVIEADMSLRAAAADFSAACHSSLSVHSPSLPDPSKCRVRLSAAVAVGEKCVVEVDVVNGRGGLCVEEVCSLECDILCELMGTMAACCVERRGQGEYEASYQPTIKGRHQLHIRIAGQHVAGSPHNVHASLPVGKLGAVLLAIEDLQRPWGVVINQRGEMVVTEYSGHCVSIFSSRAAKKILSFGTRGSGEGEFDFPTGVAVDEVGNIFVADQRNCRVQKFTREGEFITMTAKALVFTNPLGMAFNSINGNLYVADEYCIHICNSDLSSFKKFGKEGRGKGNFDRPYDVACDSAGKVYVADTSNCRVQVFTSEGVFLHMFGRQRQNWGGLTRPLCLAVDAEGLVYVTDEVNNRVTVFTSDGSLVSVFGRRGDRSGEFDFPRGIALDGDGVVYVCDRNNHRVQLF
jgi:tripartite motif-containing protein 2/3/tripartite motif-containing protein 71